MYRRFKKPTFLLSIAALLVIGLFYTIQPTLTNKIVILKSLGTKSSFDTVHFSRRIDFFNVYAQEASSDKERTAIWEPLPEDAVTNDHYQLIIYLPNNQTITRTYNFITEGNPRDRLTVDPSDWNSLTNGQEYNWSVCAYSSDSSVEPRCGGGTFKKGEGVVTGPNNPGAPPVQARCPRSCIYSERNEQTGIVSCYEGSCTDNSCLPFNDDDSTPGRCEYQAGTPQNPGCSRAVPCPTTAPVSPTPTKKPRPYTYGPCGSCSNDPQGHGCTPPEKCIVSYDEGTCSVNGAPIPDGSWCCIRDDNKCKSPPASLGTGECGMKIRHGDTSLGAYCEPCHRGDNGEFSTSCAVGFDTSCGNGPPYMDESRQRGPSSPANNTNFYLGDPVNFLWSWRGDQGPEFRPKPRPGGGGRCSVEGGPYDCFGWVCATGDAGIDESRRFFSIMIKKNQDLAWKEICRKQNIPNGTLNAGTANTSCNYVFTEPGSYEWKLRAGYDIPHEAGTYTNYSESNVRVINISEHAPQPPSNLKYTCKPDGNAITFEWKPGLYNRYYSIRLNDMEDSEGFSSNCQAPLKSDICKDQLELQTKENGNVEFSTSIVPGNKLNFWIHGANSQGLSSLTSTDTIYCPLPQNSCLYQSKVQIMDNFNNIIRDRGFVMQGTLNRRDGQTISLPPTDINSAETSTDTTLASELQRAVVKLEISTPTIFKILDPICQTISGKSTCLSKSDKNVSLDLACTGNNTYGWKVACTKYHSKVNLLDADGNPLTSNFLDQNYISITSRSPNNPPFSYFFKKSNEFSWDPEEIPLPGLKLGEEIKTTLNLPPQLEVADSFIEGCTNSSSCATFDPKDKSTLISTLTCGNNFSYGWKIRSSSEKSWHITGKAVCDDKSLAVGTVKLSYLVMGSGLDERWDSGTTGSGFVTKDITTNIRNSRVYVKLENSTATIAMMPIEVIPPKPEITFAPTVLNPPRPAAHWLREDVGSGEYTLLFKAPADMCLHNTITPTPISTTTQPTPNVTTSTVNTTPAFTPIPTPTVRRLIPKGSPTLPLILTEGVAGPQSFTVSEENKEYDSFPVMITPLSIESNTPFEKNIFVKKQELSFVVGATKEQGSIEKISLFIRMLGASDLPSDNPEAGWKEIAKIDCSQQSCTRYTTRFIIPDNFRAGTYEVIGNVVDHDSPISGQHMGTVGYVPKTLQNTATASCNTVDAKGKTFCVTPELYMKILIK